MLISEIKKGTNIHEYCIEKQIGRGAMGFVFLANQEYLARKLAIKILDEENIVDIKSSFQGFRNEANILINLMHPNIVRGYRLAKFEGLNYFAMEYISGKNLSDILFENGRIGIVRSLEIILQLVDALDYCWNRIHLVHGDIKPENIIIDDQGVLKLMDFGIARADGFINSDTSAILTPLYAAPEIVNQEPNTRLSDIYSLGATLYHLLAGNPPFPGEDSEVVVGMHLHTQPTPLHHCFSDIPEELSLYVLSLLQKDPSKRPQTWREIRTALYEICYKLELNEDNFSYIDDEKFEFNDSDNDDVIRPADQYFMNFSKEQVQILIGAASLICILLTVFAIALITIDKKTINNNYEIIIRKTSI